MYKLITYPGTPHLPPPGDLLKPFWELVFFFFFFLGHEPLVSWPCSKPFSARSSDVLMCWSTRTSANHLLLCSFSSLVIRCLELLAFPCQAGDPEAARSSLPCVGWGGHLSDPWIKSLLSRSSISIFLNIPKGRLR